MRIYKSNFMTLLVFPIVFLFSYLFSLQGPNFSKDYQGYYYYYLDVPERVEPFFKLILFLLNDLNLGLSWLFFIFLFLSIILKIKVIFNLYYFKKIPLVNLTLFFMFYSVVFFALWDLTQIRLGLCISFFLLGYFSENKYIKLISYTLSLLNHYSISLALIALFIFKFLRLSFLKILVAFLINIIILLCLKLTFYQESYENYNINETIKFLSPKMIVVSLIILFFICADYLKINRFNNNICLLYLSFFIYLTYVFLYWSYPVIAIRFLELSLFFAVLYSVFSIQTKIVFYFNIFLLLVLSVYYIDLYYISENSLIGWRKWGY